MDVIVSEPELALQVPKAELVLVPRAVEVDRPVHSPLNDSPTYRQICKQNFNDEETLHGQRVGFRNNCLNLAWNRVRAVRLSMMSFPTKRTQFNQRLSGFVVFPLEL